MVKGEHDTAIQELSLSSDQLAIKRARVDIAETSMAITSTFLDKSIAKCPKIHYLLADRRG